MTNEQLKKIRAFCGQMVENNPPLSLRREAIDILDAALAAPEQEPFCYVNVNAQGDVTRTIKREDKWCKTPLYRHPAPQSQPVARVTGYYAGRCVIEPLDGKSVFPTGMAVYSAPVGAQAAQDEPIAIVCIDRHGDESFRYSAFHSLPQGEYRLYLAPPSREWQSVTTDEIDQKIDECRMGMADYENSPTTYCRRFANELDALLRKKNSGEQA